MKKKVVQSLYSGTGGHATVVFNLLENGGMQEWDNHLVFYGIEELEKGHELFCERNDLDYLSVLKKSKVDWRGYIEIFKYFRKINPDVILVHNPLIVIPVLLYSLFHRVEIISVDHVPNNYKRRSELFFLKWITIISKYVVVLNPQHKIDLIKEHRFFKFYQSRFKVIPNGIGYSKTLKREYVPGRLGMISRFSKQKDQETLIKAFSLIIQKRQDVELYLVGSGETFDTCKRLVSDLHLSDKVVFTGNIQNEEAQKLCHTFQFFVMSTLAETVGMTVLEAYANRVPVIATEVEGLVDYMQDEVNGFLVPPKEPEMMAEKVLVLLDKEDAYFNEIIQNGIETIDRLFDTTQTFKAYNSLMKG